MSGAHGVLLTSVPGREDAARIAQTCLDERLAACVQLMPIESWYRWQGEIHRDGELLLLIKTRTALFEAAIARIKTLHPYDVPEIVALPFTAGFAGYFGWIDDVTQA